MDVERGCRGKQAYLSKAQAKQVVRLMGARHREAFHLYACPACRCWHVGHVVRATIRARFAPAFSRRAIELGAW